MKITFTKPTIYVSHPIRGVSGYIQDNCKKALVAGKRIAKVFPEVDLYIPASGDLTLQILSEAGKLNIEDIMFADLQILRACHGWFYLHWEDSTGSEEECREAIKVGLTIGREDWIRDNFAKANFQIIRNRLNDTVQAAVERFRRVV